MFPPGFGGQSSEQPCPQTWSPPVGIHLRELDNAIGTIALTITAADAAIVDKNFAVRIAVNRIRWAVLHAMRIFAVTA